MPTIELTIRNRVPFGHEHVAQAPILQQKIPAHAAKHHLIAASFQIKLERQTWASGELLGEEIGRLFPPGRHRSAIMDSAGRDIP